MVTSKMTERSSNPDAEKAGYIDVKFSANKRGKRNWYPHQWVVIVKLWVQSPGKCGAKLDIYPDEAAWKKGRSTDRRSSKILMNVESIKRSRTSRTHKYAFEVDGDEPLSLAGRNETETQDWMGFLRSIFMPKRNARFGESTFEVSVIDNQYSESIGLSGDYLLSIQSTHVHIIPASQQMKGDPCCDIHQKCYPMELSTIRSFNIAKVSDAADREKVLEILHSPEGQEKVYVFYCVKARELLTAIWQKIQTLIKIREGDDAPCVRSRASTLSTASSEYSSRAGTPTRQSAFSGVAPDELKRRMIDHQSWSHGYDKLSRNFPMVRQASADGGVQTPGVDELLFNVTESEEEEEDPYSHIGESDDDDTITTDSQTVSPTLHNTTLDGSREESPPPPPSRLSMTLRTDKDKGRSSSGGEPDSPITTDRVISGLHNTNLDGPREEESPPPPPSPRLAITMRSGRSTSGSSKASSRDSGILSPMGLEPRSSSTEEIHDRQDWRHHDSVDSAYSSSTRRGSTEPLSLTDVGELQTDKYSIDLLRESIGGDYDHPCPMGQIGSGLDTLQLDTQQDDEENIYEELSKQSCSYRKNLLAFLGTDMQSLPLNTSIDIPLEMPAESLKNTVDGPRKLKPQPELPKAQKMVVIRKVLEGLGKSDDEENVYENLDMFIKKKTKDLSKIFGADFNSELEMAPGQATRPKDLQFQRSVSVQSDQQEKSKIKRFFSISKRIKRQKKIRSPLGEMIGENSSLGSDESVDDPQKEANRMLQNLEMWPNGGTSNENLLYETSPPVPKPRTASATVVGTPKVTRERKRSKSHPNDFYVNADALARQAEADEDPVYDVPQKNNSVVSDGCEAADSRGQSSEVRSRLTPQSSTDLIGGDEDYEDLNTDPMSPFVPFKHDPFDVAWLQSQSKEQDKSLEGLREKNRIQSEPDFREKFREHGQRVAMSMPNDALTLPPPLPPDRVAVYNVDTDRASYHRTSSIELNNSALARPLSVCDDFSMTAFEVGSPGSDPYAYHNSEFIQKAQDRKSFLSDISESGRSRQGSFNIFHPEEGNMELSTSWIKSSTIDYFGAGHHISDDDDDGADYVDMSGITIQKVRSGTDNTYVSMSGSFGSRKESEC